ncbi:hypothetical protein ACJX0J_026043, partial [Zea mays]
QRMEESTQAGSSHFNLHYRQTKQLAYLYAVMQPIMVVTFVYMYIRDRKKNPITVDSHPNKLETIFVQIPQNPLSDAIQNRGRYEIAIERRSINSNVIT